MRVFRSYIVGLVLVASSLVATNAQADVLKMTFSPGNSSSATSMGSGLLGLLAIGGDTGVTFTITSTLTSGGHGGAGVIDGIYFYHADALRDIFNLEGYRTGASLTSYFPGDSNEYPFIQGGGSATVSTFDIFPMSGQTAPNGGYRFDYSQVPDGGLAQYSFTLDYLEGTGWDDFTALLTPGDEDGLWTIDWTIAVAMRSLDGGGSGGYYTNQIVTDDTYVPSDPVPEPATLAVIGLGLVGLGLARRRMGK